MSDDERKADSFGETFKEKAEDPALFENLRRAEVGRNLSNRPGTGNATSSEPPADLSGPRNPVSFDMGAERGQNAVRSSENVHQSDDLSFSQRTSNKRNISNSNDSLTGCSVWNKKTHYSEINPNESSCQPLDLSIRGASYKTDGIRDGEIGSCQKTQRSTSASSKECSSSAVSFSKNSREKGKKYLCDVCKKGFSRLHALKRHEEIHTGNKSYVCNICQTAFYQSSNLYNHLRIHADASLFACKTCRVVFSGPVCLKDHMRSHAIKKRNICEICQETFSNSSALKRHVVIHSGTKPHHCDYCDYETPHKLSLHKHLEKYHSEHKEKCPVCCQYFYSKMSLQSHKCKTI